MASETATQTRDGFTNAALSPLEDLNLRRQEIPPALAPLKQPYLSGEPMTCEDVAARLGELKAVLGPDWDAPTPEERRRTDQIADAASGFALNAVESGATGWIPFRGLVRQATGAASHEKKVARAFTLGAQQRAYLKGYGMALGCEQPARPDFDALRDAEADKVLYK
ncbi:hypothetical protein K1X12_08685 [Hyphomonas sp. WL0036]|uniref:hypothetical protein n=1 Tax=Hyphomonas sediminis TaxID=2866160 RepID=UPI001C7ED324|nr:hypothetical protein [Hyphomonas sediminis]MBY9066974.1 hypothetical protein [Hyphomonas sediminis]